MIVHRNGRIGTLRMGIQDCIDALGRIEKIRLGSRESECGYLLVDFDSKMIVSNQTGFGFQHLPLETCKRLKEWNVKWEV